MSASTMQDGDSAGEILVESVTKRFGDVTAVNDVSITIPGGEFFSMLGPSGCGKTTTLRMIAGFEAPDAGRIVLQGADVTHVPPPKRNVNMVFQAYGLFPHMTVGENIAFGPKIKKWSREETRERVAEAIRTVRLDGFEDRRPGPAQRRPAAARRARAGAREPPGRAAARRAARRARPEAAQGDAARAEGPAAAHRHDVRLRHARPRGSDDDERPHRRDERRRGGAARDAAGAVPAARERVRGRVHRHVEPDRAARRSPRRGAARDGSRRGAAHPGGRARAGQPPRSRPGDDHRAARVDQALDRRGGRPRLPRRRHRDRRGLPRLGHPADRAAADRRAADRAPAERRGRRRRSLGPDSR